MNEKIIAINKLRLDEADYRHWYSSMPLIRIFFALAIILNGVLLIIIGISLSRAGVFADPALRRSFRQLLVSLVLLLALRFGMPYIIGKKRHRQAVTMQGSAFPMDRQAVFYEDRFSIVANGVEQSVFPYKTVKSVQISKNLLIIRLPNQVYSIMRLDTFVLGSAETVIDAVCAGKKCDPQR